MNSVKEKTTGDLSNELMQESDIDSYLSSNQPYFSDESISELLVEMYQSKSISKAALARKAGMSEVYLHQVFSGRRNPSRDRLICLCIGLEATLEETQNVLKQAGYAQLYPKSRRDVIISYGLLHHMELSELNDKLFSENEKTLF